MTDHLWYPEITDALARNSHVFVHYLAFHRIDSSGEGILAEISEAGYACQSFRLDLGDSFLPEEDCKVALLVGMDALIDKPRALEQLRAGVNSWIEVYADRRVVVLSRAPRSAYPVGDGSSLVLDSRDVHLKECGMAGWIVREYETTFESAPHAAALSRGLTSQMLREMERGRPDLEALSTSIAAQTLLELGSSYIALLDEWVLEGQARSVATVDIPEWMQVELILAGVARLDLDQQNLILLDQACGPSWQQGLRLASRQCVEPPRDWRDLSACLFSIERLIRNVLAGALEEALGEKWAKQVLSGEEIAYVQRAAGLAEKFSLLDVANPLDYLTLGQLIDLADKRKEAAHAGLTTSVKLELRRVISIRNRAGHMRLPRMGDLHTTRSTLRLLELAVRSAAR